MRKTDLAYMAGVIDSDGSIGVKRSTYAMRVTGDCGQATYSERVTVRQVEPGAIDVLHAAFGGSRGMTKSAAKRGKPLHNWSVTDKKAVALLRALLPYLRIKREQAENCLELRKIKERSKKARVAKGRGHMGSARRPQELTDAMEACKQRAHELNRVGV